MSGWAIRAALFVTAMLFFVGALVGGCTYKLSTRTFTISGRSMAPAFDDGSSVSVRTDRSPQRFDIVAFRKFWDRNQPAIGRAVGLPGEAVVIQGNRASIDGAHLNDPFGLGTPSTYSVHVTLADDEFDLPRSLVHSL